MDRPRVYPRPQRTLIEITFEVLNTTEFMTFENALARKLLESSRKAMDESSRHSRELDLCIVQAQNPRKSKQDVLPLMKAAREHLLNARTQALAAKGQVVEANILARSVQSRIAFLSSDNTGAIKSDCEEILAAAKNLLIAIDHLHLGLVPAAATLQQFAS